MKITINEIKLVKNISKKYIWDTLKENKVCYAFTNNYIKYTINNFSYKTNKEIENHLKTLKSSNFKISSISGAFAWNDTKEGFDFWKDIHIKSVVKSIDNN